MATKTTKTTKTRDEVVEDAMADARYYMHKAVRSLSMAAGAYSPSEPMSAKLNALADRAADLTSDVTDAH